MEWIRDLRAKIDSGEPVDKATLLWLLDTINWQHQQMGHAWEAIVGNCQAHAVGGDGVEAWYSNSDADRFMHPSDDYPDVNRGPCSMRTSHLPWNPR